MPGGGANDRAGPLLFRRAYSSASVAVAAIPSGRPSQAVASAADSGPTSICARQRPGRTTAGCSRYRFSLVVIATSTCRPWPSSPSVRLSDRDSACPADCFAYRTPGRRGGPVPGCTSSPGSGRASGRPGTPASRSYSSVPPSLLCLLLCDGGDEGLGTIHVDRGYGCPCRASTPHSVIRPASDGPQIPRRVTRAQ